VNLASGAIAIDLGAKGRNLAIVTACASGANAIGEAYKSIQRGEQDVIVAGAADAAITPLALAGFAAMRAMYTGDNPTRACIPFDNERSGTVMGEGAGIIILEELEHARARKAPIFAEIIGYGTTCDAYSITTPEQEGTSISQAMQQALDDASISPDAVDYINAHGTSTILNDQTETRAIKKVFGEDTKIPVSSTKSMTGHLLGAGGAVEAIISIQALINDFLPATVNFKVPDPECDINLITGDGEHTNIDTVLSNSFGFGGHNASLIVKKWQN
jgi:3-oxoacyl-[acyl-carrier-protein] synthase II